MGTEIRTYNIEGHVSRHNAPKDRIHDALWSLLVARVDEVLTDPVFEPLNLERNV